MLLKSKISKQEAGVVSIVVVMIIIAITALITISFSFLVRREQKQALDNQLSTQAFYAAEAGVNDAVEKLSTLSDDIKTCDKTSDLGSNQQVDPSNPNIRYTCVLVDRSPENLIYTVKKDESKVIRVRPDTGAINTIEISWEDTSDDGSISTKFANNSSFFLPQKKVIDEAVTDPTPDPNADFANGTGILRAAITRDSDATSFDNMLSRSKTVLLYPNRGAQGTVSGVSFVKPAQSNQERIFVSGNCHDQNNASNSVDTPRYCNARINDLGGTQDLYLRLDAIYKDVNVTIRAFDSNNLANPVDIVGGQAVIDSTGKAQDVLRRVQVRVPLEDQYYRPKFALETANTICKSFLSWPGGAQEIPPINSYIYNSGSIYTDGEANNSAEDEKACLLPGNTNIPNWP